MNLFEIDYIWIFLLILPVVAFMYAAVGHGGASGYLALMALLMVKTHIASAFLIIGIIPFTRFVHFLVAPIDYIWRKYQLVIWNWDNKEIRNSRNYFPGKSRDFKNN